MVDKYMTTPNRCGDNMNKDVIRICNQCKWEGKQKDMKQNKCPVCGNLINNFEIR